MSVFCKKDSLFSCLAYEITGNELSRFSVRKRCLAYMKGLLDSKIPQTDSLVMRKWCRIEFDNDVFYVYEHMCDEMGKRGKEFLNENSEPKDPPKKYHVLFALIVANVYKVRVSLSKRTYKPDSEGLFKRNTRRTVYIFMENNHYHVKGTISMPCYTLRICNGNSENYPIGKFTDPLSTDGRVHWMKLPCYRPDLIYMIYPGESNRFRFCIPEDQILCVFDKDGSCLASSTGEYSVYPYFCLEGEIEYLAVVLAETIEEGKKAVLKERIKVEIIF